MLLTYDQSQQIPGLVRLPQKRKLIYIVCLRFSFHMPEISLFFLSGHVQRGKKVVSYSPGQVDFTFGQVNSVLNQCPTASVVF